VTGLVEAVQATKASQIYREHRPITRKRVDVAHDTGPAAIGNETGSYPLGIFNKVTDFSIGSRIGHAIGEDRDMSATHCQPIGQALPSSMRYPDNRITGD
jgi:hypothetical protein